MRITILYQGNIQQLKFVCLSIYCVGKVKTSTFPIHRITIDSHHVTPQPLLNLRNPNALWSAFTVNLLKLFLTSPYVCRVKFGEVAWNVPRFCRYTC